MNSEWDVEILLRACVLGRLFSGLCISLNCHWISDVYKNFQHFGTVRYAVEITGQSFHQIHRRIIIVSTSFSLVGFYSFVCHDSWLKWLSEPGRPKFSLGSSRDSNEKITCISVLPLHSTCLAHLKLFDVTILITEERGINYETPHPTYPSWRNTPFWQSKTAYSTNFQFPSISRGRLFHRQREDATCLGDESLLKMAIYFSPRINLQGREAEYLRA
jgi:hypothetical protein